jgi:hypothetical protein
MTGGSDDEAAMVLMRKLQLDERLAVDKGM